MEKHSDLLYLLCKPQEPMVMTKKKVQFVVPSQLLSTEYTAIAPKIMSRFGESADKQVQVKPIDAPDLREFMEIQRDDAFILLNPKHSMIAGKLTELFMKAETTDDLLALAIYCRERLNPALFHYCFSVAILHRKDTKNLTLPSMVTTFPDKFFNSKIISKARENSALFSDEKRTPIEIPVNFTASYQDKEHRLFYFREDPGLNLHHWSWHLVYPDNGPDEVVDKDRRGELFYYMHEQMVARYNIERFCNDLSRAEPYSDLTVPVKEGYFPKLDQTVTGRSYPGRVEHRKLHDLTRQGPGEPQPVDLDDVRRWGDAIIAAINARAVKDENMNEIKLDEFEGIDVLGNIMESSSLSVNRQLYGNYHNMGHLIIAFAHDPDGRHLEKSGVMGDLSTAVRDPIFYRWHTNVNNMFLLFKNSLPSYSVAQLNFPGIQVDDFYAQTEGEQVSNILRTFWTKATVNIADGLDFQTGDNLLVQMTLLQHSDFKWNITVNNHNHVNKLGTCRIFLAPKYDERGYPWKFAEQKIMFIELDKFKVNLKPGITRIVRNSIDSSVTIPFEQTYKDLTQLTDEEKDATRYCSCGWPHNLMIPKGKLDGYPCEVFVMISDYEGDKVAQEQTSNYSDECKDAYSYCGTKDQLYPDRRSMGYPFDRMPRPGVQTLREFMTPNMRVTDMKIVHSNNVYLKDEKKN